MKNTKIVSSPADRVQKTLQISYNASTGKEGIIGFQKEITNSATGNTIKIHKKDIYNNLLGFGSSSMGKVLAEFDEKTKETMGKYSLDELEAQDIVATEFLQGKFKTGTPYSISKERIGLLKKSFSLLDKSNGLIHVVGMRHGHRIGSELSEKGINEAIVTGEEIQLGDANLLFGTHQTIIESMLVSIVGGRLGLSAKDARKKLPIKRQEPYKTAQTTEFHFIGQGTNKKLIVTTNGYSLEFTEEDIKKAYDFVVSYS